MNEKIKELLAQHITPPNLAVDRDAQGQHTAHVTYTVSQAEMNTLLEAVVEECAEAVKYYKSRQFGDVYPQNILKHFGVEE